MRSLHVSLASDKIDGNINIGISKYWLHLSIDNIIYFWFFSSRSEGTSNGFNYHLFLYIFFLVYPFRYSKYASINSRLNFLFWKTHNDATVSLSITRRVPILRSGWNPGSHMKDMDCSSLLDFSDDLSIILSASIFNLKNV